MVGQAIKTLRKHRNIKQTDFAKQVDITQPNLSLMESNKLMPSMARLKIIAEKLNVPVGVLFMMSVSRNEISEEKRDTYDILMPKIKELILSLT